MMPLNDIPAYVLELAFKPDATVAELYTVGAAFAVFWAVFFNVARPLLHRFTRKTTWLRRACERDYDRNTLAEAEWAPELTRDQAIEFAMKNWAGTQPVMFQHFIGGMLCVPSLLGWGDKSWASSLAACGVLCELGYELQDTVEMTYKRFFKANGAKEYPTVVLVFTLIHHSLTSVLGVPMLIHYRELRPLHWLCFDLQIAAASTWLAEYARMLDISKKSDLRQFKVINAILLIFMSWTRMIHWTWACAQIIVTWYHDKAWTFMAAGVLPLVGFTFFNAIVCVIPMYKRFMKFLHKSAEHEALPSDASEKDRHESMLSLEKFASDLIIEETIDMNAEDRFRLFFEESVDRRGKLARTQTMPPLRKKAQRSTRMIRGFSVPANHGIWKED